MTVLLPSMEMVLALIWISYAFSESHIFLLSYYYNSSVNILKMLTHVEEGSVQELVMLDRSAEGLWKFGLISDRTEQLNSSSYWTKIKVDVFKTPWKKKD